MRLPTLTPGMRTFSWLWFGQLVSLIGTSLTEFALGLDLYNRTGSAAHFALFYLCFLVPFLVVSPFAGVLTDRWDRKKVLILADSGSACSTALIAILMVTGYYETWHMYLLVATGSAFNAFQLPAFSATTSLLVPPEHLGRADGMVQLSWGGTRIITPLLAALLVSVVPLSALFAIDFATFVFAVTISALVFIPRPPVSEEGTASKGSFFEEIAYGWKYIQSRPGLRGLLIYFIALDFSISFVQVLFTPMVLSSHSVQTLGSLISAGSAGVVVGSILMMIWGGPGQRVRAVLVLGVVFGLAMIVIGATAAVPVLAVASFIYYVIQPIINGSDEAIWQTRVPPDLQGRVLAMRHSVEWGSSPIAYAISGPLAEYVFQPLLVAGGPLAGTVGLAVGVGPGRGIGLLLMVIGMLPVAAAIWGMLHPRIRGIEREIPDVLPDGASDALDGRAPVERASLPVSAVA
jgi:DHA3 family macrolide efflux protein-like MFS transporter